MFRWGILAPGKIAKQFATGLRSLPDHRLVAVGSREVARARSFAAEFGAARAHGSYAELLADSEVDAVYVASPHTGHREHALLALAAGKPVLCEKPLAVNASQVREMIAESQRRNVFLMEAMWTRFLPIYAPIRRWLPRIGELRLVQASFGFRCGWDPSSRLLDPRLAGGGLLDVGVYAVSLATWAMQGLPTAVKAVGHVGQTGVDEQAGILLQFPGGAMAVLDCAVRTRTEPVARLIGTEGIITIEAPFWKATTARLEVGKDQETATCPHRGNGYECQAVEVARAVGGGLIESPHMSHAESLGIMEVLDAARRELGVKYPME